MYSRDYDYLCLIIHGCLSIYSIVILLLGSVYKPPFIN